MTKLTFDTEAVLKALLGSDVTPETVDAILDRLKNIVLPWRKNDAWMPPVWVRMTALGKQVGLVDSHLNGFGEAHRPRQHGWGYKGNTPVGSGACTSGIVKVDMLGWQNEAGIKECEDNARKDAMQLVDDFLRKELPFLRLLEDEK